MLYLRVGLSLAVALVAASPAPIDVKPDPRPVVKSKRVDLGNGVVVGVKVVQSELDRGGDANKPPFRRRLQITDPDGGVLQTMAYTSVWPIGRPGTEGNTCFRDFDFDGYGDMVTLRDRAGKFVLFTVWHFDSQTRTFSKDKLATALSAMENLRLDAGRHRIVTSSIGPTEPWRRTYSIENGEFQLEESCVFHNDSRDHDLLEGVVVRTHRGAPTTRTRTKVVEDSRQWPCHDDWGQREPLNEGAGCL